MGVLANHVPSIEQLKPGLVEVVEENGSSKQFFRMYMEKRYGILWFTNYQCQFLVVSPRFSPTPY